jgi:outer membrane protein TolC
MRISRAELLAMLSLTCAAALAGCATSRKAQQTVAAAAPPVVATASTSEPTNRVQLTSFHVEADDARPPEGLPIPEQIDVRGAKTLDSDRPSLPLDLPNALGLTQAQNPRVAFAQAQIAQSFAVHEAARALWLPSIRGGMSYNKHEGQIQQIDGTTFTASRGAAYGGLGAMSLTSGAPSFPGVWAYFHTADAIFQRRITGYALEAREAQASAVTNDQLLETALAYVALLEAAQRRAIATETLEHGEQLAKLTSEYARTGAGNEADADRARAALALLKNEVVRAEETQAVASARVAQQLSADPNILIVPQEDNVVPIDLVPLDAMTMGDLVATGLSNRPELSASRALVGEAVNRLKREENAPWLPSILLGMNYGAFAGGTGGQITNGGNRFDFDGIAYWELRNLGFGDKAARDNARAQIQQARMQEVQTMDLVAREVVETFSQVQARQKQIAAAKEGIAAAQRSYERNLERIRNVQGLPIEVLQSIQALDAARREYLRAVVDYNTAQFRLHRALGWPIGV